MRVEPYLFFDGRCDEAIEFYKKQLGAKVNMLMRYKDAPPAPSGGSIAPGTENKVMHGSLQIGDSTVLVSDGHCKNQPKFDGFALTLHAANDADAKRLFEALSNGGKVTMPMNKTFFASSFGMLTDRFGVMWMVIVQT